MLPVGAGTAIQVCFKFFAELLYEADDGHGRCVAERAEGAAQHVLGEVAEVVDILCHSGPGMEALEGLRQPVRALRGRECTSRSFRGGKTDWYAGRT